MQFQHELDEMIQEENCYGESTLRYSCEYGSWVGSTSETAIRAHLRVSAPNKKLPNVRLYKHLRAYGTVISAPQYQRPSTSPMDANTRRDNDDNENLQRWNQ